MDLGPVRPKKCVLLIWVVFGREAFTSSESDSNVASKIYNILPFTIHNKQKQFSLKNRCSTYLPNPFAFGFAVA